MLRRDLIEFALVVPQVATDFLKRLDFQLPAPEPKEATLPTARKIWASIKAAQERSASNSRGCGPQMSPMRPPCTHADMVREALFP